MNSTPLTDMHARPSRAEWLGVTFIALAATLPFLGKAFHIDDPLYLAVARQILNDPVDPFGGEILWEQVPESLFDADFNPPLWSYFLAGVLAVTGEPEVRVEPAEPAADGTPRFRAATSRVPEFATHLLESVFVAAAIVAMFLLGRRYVRWPVAAVALVALSPAMLPSQNVMLEGPVLAFWLWAVYCHLRAIDANDRAWTWATGVLTALAVLTKYTSGLVIVLLAAYSIRRRHWRSLWFVIVPVAALGLWSLHNWFVYERLHVLVIFSRVQTGERTPVGVSVYESWGRLLALLRAVGAVTALSIPVIGIITRRFGAWSIALLVIAALFVALIGERDMAGRIEIRDGDIRSPILPPSLPAHLLVFGTLGSLAAGGLVLASRDLHKTGSIDRSAVQPLNGSTSDNNFLLWIWLVAVAAFAVLATPFLAVRHLLPGLPPFVWLVLRRLDDAFGEQPRASIGVLATTVAVSTFAGFLTAKADYEFAEWYRHVAVDVGSRTVTAGKLVDKTVWFTGHWGWSYYAERAGMRPFMPGRTEMGEGDFLLLPLVQTWQLPPKELVPHLRGAMRPIHPTPRPIHTGSTALDTLLDWSLNSVRTVSHEVHLYGSGTLTIPWRLSRQPFDDFGVVEVKSVPKSDADRAENYPTP